MTKAIHRARAGVALAVLLPLATGCEGPPFAPQGPRNQPPLVLPPAAKVSGTRAAFAECFEWGWDEQFQDVCASRGIAIRYPDRSEVRVLAGTEYYPDDPAWSPDGERIAFAGYPDCESCLPDIYVMNDDGSSVRRLTTSGASQPAWTPDGRISYVSLIRDSNNGITQRLRTVNPDGSGDVTLGDLEGTTPAWSPDGMQLAFSARADGGAWRVYIADADGGNARRITEGEDRADDFRPSWSPDGQRLAFTRVWTRSNGSGNCQVFVTNADGSDVLQLTQDVFCAHNAAWSPDGETIAFNGTEAPGSYGIMLMNADGTGAWLLRRTVGWPSRVAWAPVP